MPRKKAGGHHFHKPDIPDAEQSAYMVLNDVSRMIQKRLKRGSESIGLKQGYRHILFHLAHGDNGGTQQDLVKHTKLSAPTISVSLSKMEEEGIVSRKTDIEDMRIVRVFLTEKGWAYDRAMRETFDGVESEFSGALTAGELTELKNTLIKVRDYLSGSKNRVEKAD